MALTGIANSFFQLELIAGKYDRKGWTILAVQTCAATVILVGNWFLLPRVGIVAAAGTSLTAYLIMIVALRFYARKEIRFSYFNLRAGAMPYLQRLFQWCAGIKKGY